MRLPGRWTWYMILDGSLDGYLCVDPSFRRKPEGTIHISSATEPGPKRFLPGSCSPGTCEGCCCRFESGGTERSLGAKLPGPSCEATCGAAGLWRSPLLPSARENGSSQKKVSMPRACSLWWRAKLCSVVEGILCGAIGAAIGPTPGPWRTAMGAEAFPGRPQSQ